jgi:hypothetical protein
MLKLVSNHIVSCRGNHYVAAGIIRNPACPIRFFSAKRRGRCDSFIARPLSPYINDPGRYGQRVCRQGERMPDESVGKGAVASCLKEPSSTTPSVYPSRARRHPERIDAGSRHGGFPHQLRSARSGRDRLGHSPLFHPRAQTTWVVKSSWLSPDQLFPAPAVDPGAASRPCHRIETDLCSARPRRCVCGLMIAS